MRAVGVRLLHEGKTARVYLPSSDARETVDNLLATRRIAVTLSKPLTHRSVQLKGEILNIGQTPANERNDVERLFKPFLDDLAFLGIPRAVAARMNRWPCWFVDFSIHGVFEQTPGPMAGRPLGASS